jgi:hypothetical protein
MTTFHLFSRTAYADPLERVTTFEHDGTPGLDDLPVGRDPAWLEVVVVPDDALTWVLCGGSLVPDVPLPPPPAESGTTPAPSDVTA